MQALFDHFLDQPEPIVVRAACRSGSYRWRAVATPVAHDFRHHGGTQPFPSAKENYSARMGRERRLPSEWQPLGQHGAIGANHSRDSNLGYSLFQQEPDVQASGSWTAPPAQALQVCLHRSI